MAAESGLLITFPRQEKWCCSDVPPRCTLLY